MDLDGTLIRTDMLWESVAALLSANPFYMFMLPIWLLGGRAHLKQQVAARAEIDVTTLPYSEEFLEYLRSQNRNGRQLILVTAADQRIAAAIAGYLKLFSEVMASDGAVNLKGSRKRAALDARFGGDYDYAGNSRADLTVWQGAKAAVVVNAGERLCRSAASVTSVEQTFHRSGSRFRALRKGLRIHQWVKNALVFLPVITAHQVLNLDVMRAALHAFGAFSLCASSVYVLNDLLDLRNDRLHATKRRRPFANGTLSIPLGFLLVPTLLLGSAVLCYGLPAMFAAMLAVYYALTVAYSFWLKRRLLVDVFALGGLYTIRVLAGGAATGIMPSPWLLTFCLFFFLSLALAKRFAELRRFATGAETMATAKVSGRGYEAGDQIAISSLGSSSGFMAVLVLALYMNSPQVLALYREPWMLWLIYPVLLYWISRVWLLAWRGKLHDDPVVFAIRDRVSYFAILCCAVIIAISSKSWTSP